MACLLSGGLCGGRCRPKASRRTGPALERKRGGTGGAGAGAGLAAPREPDEQPRRAGVVEEGAQAVHRRQVPRELDGAEEHEKFLEALQLYVPAARAGREDGSLHARAALPFSAGKALLQGALEGLVDRLEQAPCKVAPSRSLWGRGERGGGGGGVRDERWLSGVRSWQALSQACIRCPSRPTSPAWGTTSPGGLSLPCCCRFDRDWKKIEAFVGGER